MSEAVEVTLARLEVIVADIRTDVSEIKRQTTETNGRVRKLETWQAGVQAIGRLNAAVWGAVGVFATTAGAGIAVALLT